MWQPPEAPKPIDRYQGSHERALILAYEACHWTLELQMCAVQTPRINISKHTNKVEFVNARRARV
jgi:hypothetical protein